MVRAIHAGLECGLIYEKIKGIDMISFGPTIRGAHTPEEMIEIKTAQMFWDLLIDVVTNMPVKSIDHYRSFRLSISILRNSSLPAPHTGQI